MLPAMSIVVANSAGPPLQVVMGMPAADAVESVSNGTVDAAVVDGQALNMLGTSQQAQVSEFAILDGVSSVCKGCYTACWLLPDPGRLGRLQCAQMPQQTGTGPGNCPL